MRRQVGELAPAPMAAWFRDYLGRVDEALASADPGVRGMGRERFKRDAIDVADALAAAAAISVGVDAWERMLSERIFGRSKRLFAIRSVVAKLLLRSDPGWAGFELDEGVRTPERQADRGRQADRERTPARAPARTDREARH